MSIILASTVAIIGGGPSGLVTAKEAKACGLTPTVFEKSSSIGGVWNPEEGKVWDSLKINNSRFSSCFSDFPWDENADDFPNSKEVYHYLCNYAKHNDLYENTKLNCNVTKIRRLNDQWAVEWIRDEKYLETSLFDSVVICSGLYSKGYTPQIQGLETFSGRVIHSENYKKPDSFLGRKVAIIGNSFSGTEIAADIALKADKVFHIYHRPYWILSRYRKEKETQRLIPFDLISFKRNSLAQNETQDEHNERINKILVELCSEQFKIDPNLIISSSLKEFPFLTTSDTYLHHVKKRVIIPKNGRIQKIDGSMLILEDESRLEVDDLVFSTGYCTDASFFDQSMQKELEFDSSPSLQPFLLHNIFHPKFPNMAFICLARHSISFGILELQARLACMTLSKKIAWPSDSIMEEGLKESREFRCKKMKSQHRFSNHMLICENLAKELNVLPDFSKIQRENPTLYDQLMNGPFTPAGYRLCGFGSNEEMALKILDEITKRAGKPAGPRELYFHE
ncbi:MAG TPA: NAD(P)-binding domain-containing protein [Chlamydiales bacterium]|nr:NAD(P)-binding domain-containing protein [Chlamydiales bacterium]